MKPKSASITGRSKTNTVSILSGRSTLRKEDETDGSMKKKPRAGGVALHGSRFVRKWICKDLGAFHMEIMSFVTIIELQTASKSDLKTRASVQVEL